MLLLMITYLLEIQTIKIAWNNLSDTQVSTPPMSNKSFHAATHGVSQTYS